MLSKIGTPVPCNKSLRLRGKNICNTIGQYLPHTRVTIRRVNDNTIVPIASNGKNRFPAAIKNVLLDHPQVTELAVIGVPGDRWGEAIAISTANT
jgi:hypothetical protein